MQGRMALSYAMQEDNFLKQLMDDDETPVNIYVDNQEELAKNPIHHWRLKKIKKIGITYHYITYKYRFAICNFKQ